jgi:hypothetical protein
VRAGRIRTPLPGKYLGGETRFHAILGSSKFQN